MNSERTPLAGEPVDLRSSHNLIEQYRAIKAQIKIKEEELLAVRELLEKEMGSGSEGVIAGKVVLTWQTRSSRRVDAKRLKELHPDAYRDVAVSTRTRYFTVKP